MVTKADGFKSGASQVIGELDRADGTGRNLTDNGEGRIVWLEVLKAINRCLPVDPDGENRPEDLAMRNQVFLTGMECQKTNDVAAWFNAQRKWYEPPTIKGGGDSEAVEGQVTGPTGEGWIFQVTGYHFHNQETPQPGYSQAAQFVRETLMDNLLNTKILLPKVSEIGEEEVSMAELGIGYPILINPDIPKRVSVSKGEPGAPRTGMGGMMGGMMGMDEGYEMGMETEMSMGMGDQYMTMGGVTGQPKAKAEEEEEEEKPIDLLQFEFTVQFVWQKTPPSVRHGEVPGAVDEAAALDGGTDTTDTAETESNE